tara:strand:+ start:330 stop:1055 length:726 start_codon:yes stop_codon:yes gene_type:complete
MPSYFDHNLGLRHLIEPGDDMSATQVRENFGRIKHATNNMVEASIEPEAINTRHLSTENADEAVDGMWKSILFTSSKVSPHPITLANDVAYGTVRWKCTFGTALAPVVPNVPLFITVVLLVNDIPSGSLDARYHFKLQAITPTGGTLADITWNGMKKGNASVTERSITLASSNGTTTANGREYRHVVLSTPYIPAGAPSDDLTSLDLALLTKTTNYAGTGAASKSTMVLWQSAVTIMAIRR